MGGGGGVDGGTDQKQTLAIGADYYSVYDKSGWGGVEVGGAGLSMNR